MLYIYQSYFHIVKIAPNKNANLNLEKKNCRGRPAQGVDSCVKKII